MLSHDSRQVESLEPDQRLIGVAPIRTHIIIDFRSHLAYFVTNTPHHLFWIYLDTCIVLYQRSQRGQVSRK